MSDADYRALAEFRYQIRRFLSTSERLAQAAGLEPRQYQLLLSLRGLPEDLTPTIGTLAERLQLQHHSTVELVNRLEHRGMVHRTRSDTDRREVFVNLTTAGTEVLQLLSVAHREELRSRAPELIHALTTITGSVETPEAIEDARNEH